MSHALDLWCGHRDMRLPAPRRWPRARRPRRAPPSTDREHPPLAGRVDDTRTRATAFTSPACASTCRCCEVFATLCPISAASSIDGALALRPARRRSQRGDRFRAPLRPKRSGEQRILRVPVGHHKAPRSISSIYRLNLENQLRYSPSRPAGAKPRSRHAVEGGWRSTSAS